MFENIEVLTHSSIRIKDGEKIIYVDPFNLKGENPKADYIFVTHEHYDHFSPEDIGKITSDETVLVVPENMKKKAKEAGIPEARIYIVKPGEKCLIGSLEFETVRAYNEGKHFHPKKDEWVGYIINAGGERIYIAGDTDATEDARAVKCDIALVPVGGKYTMDAEEAAELVNTIAPKGAVPTHYGSVAGGEEAGEVFAGLVSEGIETAILKQY